MSGKTAIRPKVPSFGVPQKKYLARRRGAAGNELVDRCNLCNSLRLSAFACGLFCSDSMETACRDAVVDPKSFVQTPDEVTMASQRTRRQFLALGDLNRGQD